MWEFTDPLWFRIIWDICLLTWIGLLLAMLLWENPSLQSLDPLFVVLIFFFKKVLFMDFSIIVVILD